MDSCPSTALKSMISGERDIDASPARKPECFSDRYDSRTGRSFKNAEICLSTEKDDERS